MFLNPKRHFSIMIFKFLKTLKVAAAEGDDHADHDHHVTSLTTAQAEVTKFENLITAFQRKF